MSVKQVHIERSCYQSTTALDLKPTKKSSRDIYIELLDRALQALQEGKDQEINSDDGKDVPLHNVDLALKKVVELHYHYHLNTKLVAGANNLLGAISNSPAGRVRTILNELSHEKHEARYKLSGLESEFKEFLGYLHIEPKSIIGHGRLCGGDVYEVSIKCGTQKIKTQCKIDSCLQQKWKDTQKSLKITYHEQITIKVTDKRKYERNVHVGEVTFSLMNLLSVRPLNIILALGSCTSLRLNFTLAWTPVVKGQQINFDPFGKLKFQDTVVGGLCGSGFGVAGGLLKHRAASLAQLQQLSIHEPFAASPSGMTSATSMVSITETPEQPLAALLQDTIMLYEDFELQFSEVKDLLSTLRQLRNDLRPASNGTLSSATSSVDTVPEYGSIDNISSGGISNNSTPLPGIHISGGGGIGGGGGGDLAHARNHQLFSSAREFSGSSMHLSESGSSISSPYRDTKWISESMKVRPRKKSIFSSVRQKKYKRYNVPVAPLFNNYDYTLKKTRLTSKNDQVDRFLSVHLQYLQDICTNLQCSYLLKNRQQNTLQIVRDHVSLLARVRTWLRERGELVAVAVEPGLMEDRWRGLWNVISDDKFCTVSYHVLLEKLSAHYGNIVQGSNEDVFKYLVQCITDTVGSKFIDTTTATVCQVIRFFKERSGNGVGRFVQKFCLEYGIVHGLQAPLLREREDAVQKYQNMPFSGTKFRIAMCMMGSTRAEAANLVKSTFTEVKNSDTMRLTADKECCKGLEDLSPYVRHCTCLAIEELDTKGSLQLLQRIASVDLDHIRKVALTSLNRWGLKEDPLKEGVHPYLSLRIESEFKEDDILHFSLRIPAL